jgi:TPR repeat protein
MAEILKTFDGRKVILVAIGLSIIVLLVIGCVIYFSKSSILEHEAMRGYRPFHLTQGELSKLGAEAEKGNCASEYRLAQYHLYSSLELSQAEKYFRQAAKCQNADALVGLITILRNPENDAMVDDLLTTLKMIDAKKGESASEEVALRRAERTLK